MKKYYQSTVTGLIIEALSDTKGLIVKSNDSDFVVGREYVFFPFIGKDSYWMWKEISIQDIPVTVSLKDISNLIQSQKFLDWFNSEESTNVEKTFTFLKENLDVK